MLSVSIITPSLNQGAYIERTIQSVLSQGIADIEYVVVDGGSTDGTLDILTQSEPELRWISEKDRGQADAVNKGLQTTKGDIIGWLNSDDIYYPGTLWLVTALFERYPERDVIYGDAYHIDIGDSVIAPYPTEPWNRERLKKACYICQPAAFFRRRVINRVGFLDDRLTYCLDYELWLRLCEMGAKFMYVPEILAGSRLYPSAKTLGMRIKTIQETNHMLSWRLGYVPDEWLLSYARIFLNRVGIRRIDGGRLDSPLSEPASDMKANRNLNLLAVAPILAVSAVLISLFASLRWNRRISWTLIKTVCDWILSHGRALSRKHFSSFKDI
ncbi:MAG: glycosyltransferase family 2 protein [Deltaproteobacteria bacterium]